MKVLLVEDDGEFELKIYNDVPLDR